ncbi:MAG: peptidase M14, partial [Aliifodinibius sp.]|nr:peptidase M14 [Fodinibius sp.]
MNWDVLPSSKRCFRIIFAGLKVSLLLVAFHFISPAVFAQESQMKYSEVKININSREDILDLRNAGLQFDHIQYHQDYFQTVLSSRDMEILKSTGYTYEVVIEDLSAYYAERNRISAAEKRALQREMKETFNITGFEFGSMGGYYTFAEVLTELDSMRMVYPNLVTAKQSIGTSIEGRDIWMVKISDNPDVNEGEPEILYNALHHAREPQGMAAVIYFMYYLLENYGTDPEVTFLVNNRELYFVPVLNPDGYVYNEQTNPNGGGMWRKNRRNNGGGSYGVDLNRNYGYQWGYDNSGSSPYPSDPTYRGTAPFSEPEIQAIRDFCLNHDFQLALNYHTYGDYLIYPWGYINALTPDSATYIALADTMTMYNNYTYGTGFQTVGYPVNGDSDDWMYGEQTSKDKMFSMTPEVGYSFWP